MLDFHPPATPVLWPGLALFMWLFETETAWQMLQENIPEVLADIGFHLRDRRFHAFGSLQVIQAQKLA
jgi:demethylmenaquinone methyltransferase/2-methoxy-6-polyprenyl-1,4-benzoquinol methylase